MLKSTRNVIRLLLGIVIASIPPRPMAQGPFLMDTSQPSQNYPCPAVRNLRHPKDEEPVCDHGFLRIGSWKQFQWCLRNCKAWSPVLSASHLLAGPWDPNWALLLQSLLNFAVESGVWSSGNSQGSQLPPLLTNSSRPEISAPDTEDMRMWGLPASSMPTA